MRPLYRPGVTGPPPHGTANDTADPFPLARIRIEGATIVLGDVHLMSRSIRAATTGSMLHQLGL